jgi:hypothetical protein
MPLSLEMGPDYFYIHDGNINWQIDLKAMKENWEKTYGELEPYQSSLFPEIVMQELGEYKKPRRKRYED